MIRPQNPRATPWRSSPAASPTPPRSPATKSSNSTSLIPTSKALPSAHSPASNASTSTPMLRKLSPSPSLPANSPSLTPKAIAAFPPGPSTCGSAPASPSPSPATPLPRAKRPTATSPPPPPSPTNNLDAERHPAIVNFISSTLFPGYCPPNGGSHDQSQRLLQQPTGQAFRHQLLLHQAHPHGPPALRPNSA